VTCEPSLPVALFPPVSPARLSQGPVSHEAQGPSIIGDRCCSRPARHASCSVSNAHMQSVGKEIGSARDY